MLANLSDQLLIEAYQKAIKLGLNERFIEILLEEMKKRGLDPNLHN